MGSTTANWVLGSGGRLVGRSIMPGLCFGGIETTTEDSARSGARSPE